MAFLVKSGLASAVITEDSDILVYMAAVKSTAPVLYKMDEFGTCKELGFDPEKLSSLPGTCSPSLPRSVVCTVKGDVACSSSFQVLSRLNALCEICGD